MLQDTSVYDFVSINSVSTVATLVTFQKPVTVIYCKKDMSKSMLLKRWGQNQPIFEIVIMQDSADLYNLEEIFIQSENATQLLCDLTAKHNRCCTQCLKKTCQLFFALRLSNMNRFQWRFVGISWIKHLMKACIKYPIHLKYVLALPCEIWSESLSPERSTYITCTF